MKKKNIYEKKKNILSKIYNKSKTENLKFFKYSVNFLSKILC